MLFVVAKSENLKIWFDGYLKAQMFGRVIYYAVIPAQEYTTFTNYQAHLFLILLNVGKEFEVPRKPS